MIRKFGLLLLLCAALFLCFGPLNLLAAHYPDKPKRILIIPSYNFDYKGIQWFLQGVMAEFKERKPFNVIFSFENLQLSTHSADRKYIDNMAASLKIKYSLEKPDLIIVQYKQALEFMERYRMEIFGNIPVVFAGLSVEGYTPERLPDHYTGIVASFSAARNIELILRNHPATRKIYIVGGFSSVEQNLVTEAIKEGAPYREKVKFVALTEMTYPALLEKLGTLEIDSAVIYQALQLDAAGKVFVPAQAAIEIAKASRVPVYGMLDTYTGSGITGGFLIHHEGLGRRAAKIAIDWLQSGVAPEAKVKTEQIGCYWFDWRKLKHWKIEEDRLPPESKVEFKIFNVWESYRREIIAGVGIVLLQTLLIIGLLWNRNRRVKAEEKLRSSKALLNNIIEGTTDAIYVKDIEGRYILLNSAAEIVFGKRAVDVLGKDDFDIFLSSEAQVVMKSDRNVMGGGIVKTYEEIVTTAAGQKTTYLSTKGPIYDASGRPSGLFSIARDITERKRAEKRIHEMTERLRLATASAKAGVWDWNLQTNDMIWDERMLELYGLTHASFPGGIKAWEQGLHPDDAARAIEECRAALRGERDFDTEFRVRHPDGTVVYIKANGLVLRDEQGESIRMIGLNTDMTEQHQIEEERKILHERLQRAEKMEALGTLAGGVAHDLNNVLGIVVGYAGMLLDDVEETSPIRSELQNILSGGERAAAIVQDLLTLARRGVSNRKVLNLSRMVADSQGSPEFKTLCSYHPSVQIRIDLEPNILNLSGSPVHIGKTLFNLVSNGCESMPTGGVLTISTANQYIDRPIQGYDEVREGDYVVLSVSDTGEGIPADDLKRIFEPFYTKKVMGRSGTGLGLAVVWGTVKDHKGYINVQSEEGKGSTFTLYFPVTRDEITADQAAIPVSEYMGRGESILIVDDVKGQRELAAAMLRKLNYSVSSVASGEEAVAYLKGHQADLLVLDMIMDPGMDGLDTYRKVLENSPKQRAIIVSGFSETDRVKEAERLGAGAYVKKPYVSEILGLAVRKELDRAA